MTTTHPAPKRSSRPAVILAVSLVLIVVAFGALPRGVLAQDAGLRSDEPAVGDFDRAAAEAEAALSAEEPVAEAAENEPQQSEAPVVAEQINLLELLAKGGRLMWPIAFMSLMVVAFGAERMLGLRRRRVLPPGLIDGLNKLAEQPPGLDPRKAYQLCHQFPSSAARVVKKMLMKVGRPQTELEQTVSEACNREAARLYANVRWLSLAAGISPLLGLLGTVWGMIQAFFATANLPTGANKAEHLAEGIYVALVTTFAGLSVAIPAAILAHWFEGRIQKLFRDLDEALLGLMPRLERFEGRVRVSKTALDRPTGAPPVCRDADVDGDVYNKPAAAPK